MRDLAVGTTIPSQTYVMNRQTLIDYANASGDQNPIHQNEEFAKSVGLPDVIAHGMLTMALASRFVAQWAGDVSKVKEFSARFTKPVVVPADVDVELVVSAVIDEVTARSVTLDISAECAGIKVLGMAKATIALL